MSNTWGNARWCYLWDFWVILTSTKVNVQYQCSESFLSLCFDTEHRNTAPFIVKSPLWRGSGKPCSHYNEEVNPEHSGDWRLHLCCSTWRRLLAAAEIKSQSFIFFSECKLTFWQTSAAPHLLSVVQEEDNRFSNSSAESGGVFQLSLKWCCLQELAW